MPSNKFKTVPDELVEFAEACATHFGNNGYRVLIEREELGFPYTPTLIATRKPVTLILEVSNKIDPARLEAWTRYGKSCGGDTRVALCVPYIVAVSNEQIEGLRALSLGFYVIFKDHVAEHIAPIDLALNVSLPPLESLPERTRELLGSAYDQFSRSHWREGFEDACQVLETEARGYLRKWSKTGRIKIVGKTGPVTLTAAQINHMTIGQLAKKFGQIQAQNHDDSLIEKLLLGLNKDRVGVVHHKKRAWTEKRLRTNVGQHMWKSIAGLRIIV